MDYWINSFGGARSNYIHKTLASKYDVDHEKIAWNACHTLNPNLVLNFPSQHPKAGIFVYCNDIGIAMSSQIKRGLDTLNYTKCLGITHRVVSTDYLQWLSGINLQLKFWTKTTLFPIYLINSDYLDEPKYRKKFEKEFGVKLPEYKSRKTAAWSDKIDIFDVEIRQINQMIGRLPKFAKLDRTTFLKHIWTSLRYPHDFFKGLQ
jgi:hypothetical protein